jgi:hypothetical protein
MTGAYILVILECGELQLELQLDLPEGERRGGDYR